MKGKTDARTEARNMLTDQWENIWYDLLDFRFSVDGFKNVFLKTWDYFRSYAGEQTVDRGDLALYKYIAMFTAASDYPTHTKPWIFDACVIFAKGLCDILTQDQGVFGKLAEGTMSVDVYINQTMSVNIAKFEEAFVKITNMYKADYDDMD